MLYLAIAGAVPVSCVCYASAFVPADRNEARNPLLQVVCREAELRQYKCSACCYQDFGESSVERWWNSVRTERPTGIILQVRVSAERSELMSTFENKLLGITERSELMSTFENKQLRIRHR